MAEINRRNKLLTEEDVSSHTSSIAYNCKNVCGNDSNSGSTTRNSASMGEYERKSSELNASYAKLVSVTTLSFDRHDSCGRKKAATTNVGAMTKNNTKPNQKLRPSL